MASSVPSVCNYPVLPALLGIAAVVLEIFTGPQRISTWINHTCVSSGSAIPAFHLGQHLSYDHAPSHFGCNLPFRTRKLRSFCS